MPTAASARPDLQARNFIKRGMLARVGPSLGSFSKSNADTQRRGRQVHCKVNLETSNIGASMMGRPSSVKNSLSTNPSGTEYILPVAARSFNSNTAGSTAKPGDGALLKTLGRAMRGDPTTGRSMQLGGETRRPNRRGGQTQPRPGLRKPRRLATGDLLNSGKGFADPPA